VFEVSVEVGNGPVLELVVDSASFRILLMKYSF
jgi:hypothetical protein